MESTSGITGRVEWSGVSVKLESGNRQSKCLF